MPTPKLTLERRGHVLLMGFNRADKRNAFDVDTYLALAAAYGELDRDPDLRAAYCSAMATTSRQGWT